MIFMTIDTRRAARERESAQFYNLDLVHTTSQTNRRARLRRMLGISVLSVVGVGLLVFASDYAVFRVRVAANWNAYDSVTVEHYDAVAQKNGKTQFIFDPPGPQTCV